MLARQILEETSDDPLSKELDVHAVLVEPMDTRKDPAAVAAGRLGGLKDGKARADTRSPAKRKAIARKPGLTRRKKD